MLIMIKNELIVNLIAEVVANSRDKSFKLKKSINLELIWLNKFVSQISLHPCNWFCNWSYV
jgi:hypothetical protein